MPENYAEVEKRVSKAVEAIQTRKNVCRSKIAREFRVPVQRLRSRLAGHPSKSTMRGLHGRKLAPDQEKALHAYFVELDKTGLPARLHVIGKLASSNERQSQYPAPSSWTQMAKTMAAAAARPLQG